MNLGLSIRDLKDFDTHLNLNSDFTGSRESISSITSGGMSDIFCGEMVTCRGADRV